MEITQSYRIQIVGHHRRLQYVCRSNIQYTITIRELATKTLFDIRLKLNSLKSNLLGGTGGGRSEGTGCLGRFPRGTV